MGVTATTIEPKYYGNWTVTYRLKGKSKPRDFIALPGWTEADAIKCALDYLRGWDVEIIGARKEQKRQVQLGLPL